MFPQDLLTLGVSITNRKLQWCAVVLSFETSIDAIITEELCDDGGAVVEYCLVQCGVVEPTTVGILVDNVRNERLRLK